MATVPAVVAPRPLPVDDPGALVDSEIEIGAPGPYDLLVDVRAVSVNPVDRKVRSSFDPADGPKVLGFDAAGVVVETGESVQGYAPGDEVYYAGSIDRPGSNAHRQLVDSRVVGRKPSTLDFAAAAALPLTSLTAWECLHDHLRITADSAGTMLVVSAAGGVGSMVLQLGRRTALALVGTASRHESAEWAREMGAHAIADHRDLVGSVRRAAPDGVQYVFSPVSVGNVEAYAELMTPRGVVVAIDEPEGLDTLPLKTKSQAWHWELMFTRPLFEPEGGVQRGILDEVASLVDTGELRTTETTRLHGLTAGSVREAHRLIETGSSIGKIVIER